MIISPVPAPQAKRFRCESCGAEMTFDPTAGALACAYCGARRAAGAAGPAPIIEHDFCAGLATATRGLGMARTEVQCTECGAAVLLEPEVIASKCSFCGAPTVVASAAEAPIRP